MNKTHGSLFSGFDAPSVAASWLGWKNAFHCEINSFCNEILKYWFPDSEHYEDITKTDFSQWKGRIDVLTGGFPCQPFSLAGQRKGADDNRYLWPEMLRAIREIRPTWVIGENVAGILTMVQPGEETEMGSQTALFGEDNRKRVLLRQEYVVETICKDLEREGYSVQPLLIPACAVGAPHRRDRVWFVAHRNDAPHPDLDRCRNGKNKQEPLTQCKGTSNNCFSSKDGVVTYSQCPRSGQIRKKVQSKQSDGNSFDRNGGKRDVANAKSKQSERDRLEQPKDCATEQRESGRSSSENNSKYATRGWKNFPTQSPVCRGNDGLPVHDNCISLFEERNKMDRDYIIYNSLKSKKLYVNYDTGEIYSTSIRGYEGEHIKLKGSVCSGYIVHTISFNGIKKQCRAHQIVWISANGLYDKEKYQIDHINRNRQDNRLSNLRLVTCKENIANQERHGTNILSIEDRLKVCELFYIGHMKMREIAEDFGVSKSTIFNIIHKINVDNLTIPFTKWRQESVKGYGNAIVPQVILEIFKAIEELDN